jgi:hypothetical protein
MSLSKQQMAQKDRFQKWFFLHERDLLECARRWPAWRSKAHELGFTDTKIDAPWIHADAGRQIAYMEIPR